MSYPQPEHTFLNIEYVIQKSDRTGDKVVAKSVQVNVKVRVTNGVDSSHLHFLLIEHGV